MFKNLNNTTKNFVNEQKSKGISNPKPSKHNLIPVDKTEFGFSFKLTKKLQELSLQKKSKNSNSEQKVFEASQNIDQINFGNESLSQIINVCSNDIEHFAGSSLKEMFESSKKNSQLDKGFIIDSQGDSISIEQNSN